MAKDIKEKIKDVIKEHRKKQKVEGKKRIAGVMERKKKKPTKRAENEVVSRKDKETKRQVGVGPRGGKYIQAATGKKYYLQREKERTYHRVAKSEIKTIVEKIGNESEE